MDKIIFKKSIMKSSERYFTNHPFYRDMNEGRVSRAGIQLWAANRYYYQKTVPRKDSYILMNCDNEVIRKKMIHRIMNYDELQQVTAWWKFCKAVDLPDKVLDTEQLVLPGVKFAVDNHLNFCRNSNFHDSLSTCVTDTFGPEFHNLRLEKWKQNYKWIESPGFDYFVNTNAERNNRNTQNDDFIIDHILEHYKTPDEQLRALSIINFKLNVLWCILDAVQLKYMFFNNLPSNEIQLN